MKREWITLLIVVPLIALFAFYGEQSPVERVKKGVSINDDFFTLLGNQTSVWKSYVRDTDLEGIEKFRVVYDKNKNLQFDSGPHFRIPKTIHFIWIGPNNFPRESVENVRSWIAHHPDWTVKFWTDRERPPPSSSMEVHYVNDFTFKFLKQKYHEAMNWAEKSDVLRYEILYQEGGVYVDHDANCLRPFHGLNRGYDFYACLELPHTEVDQMTITAGIGIIGSKPGHPVVKGTIDLVNDRWKRVTTNFESQDPETKRELVLHRTYISMTHSLNKFLDLPGNNDIVFPASYFYAKEALPSLYSQHFYGAKWEKETKTSLVTQLPTVLRDMKQNVKRTVKLQFFALLLMCGCFFLFFRIRKIIVLPLLLMSFGALEAKESEFHHLMGEKQGAFKYIQTLEDFQNFDFYKGVYDHHKTLFSGHVARIPKKLHFVWFGPTKMPVDSQKNILSWMKHHPDWEVYLWTDRPRKLPSSKIQQKLVREITFTKLGNCFVDATSYREKADVLRYEILYQHGGVAVDHDVICHRSFLPFHESYDFYCGMLPIQSATLSSSVLASNSIVGAKPRHPILHLCLALVKDKWGKAAQYYPDSDKESKIYRVFYRVFEPFDQAVKTRVNHLANRDIVFPCGYFNRIDNDFGIYANHKYGCTWFDGETKIERALKKQVEALSYKLDELMYFTVGFVFLMIILFAVFLHLYKKLQRQ